MSCIWTNRFNFDAEIFLVEGNSVDVVTDWVARHGLPTAPTPRWPLEEALDRIAEAYTTHLWHEGEGFGTQQRSGEIQPTVPRFAEAYIERRSGTALAAALQEKIDWCREGQSGPAAPDPAQLHSRGEEILSWQADGRFLPL